MNRLSKWFAALLLTVGLCAVPAGAANQVERLATDVALEQDGSAHVTQVFAARTDEGTEFYMDRLTSGGLTYANFAVADENGPYAMTADDRWDVDASFTEKAGRCGLVNIDGGVELCWGITDYGAHTYTVSYDIGGLAGGYSDADGLLYRFIDPDQSVFPTNADLIIRMADGTPLTQDNCGIWAFGFEGQIQFENGIIHAWTDSPLEGGQYLTAMVQLQPGLLQPQRVEEGSFRRDLYYRLNTLPVLIPPLREREGDLLLLIDHFRRNIGASFTLSPELERLLLAHQWRGNIRELRNVVEYFSYLGHSVVGAEELPPTFRYLPAAAPPAELPALADCPREDARFVLERLYEADLAAAREAGLPCSQQEVRRILAGLDRAGLVRVSRGRGGTRLTPAGRALCRRQAVEGGAEMV